MFKRQFAAFIVATLALPLIGVPAAAAATAPTAARRPSPGVLSAEQIAKRDAFAAQTGIPAAALDGPWHIVNRNSGKCLTVYRAGTANNTKAVQYTCDHTAPFNEEWYRVDFWGEGSYYHLLNGTNVNLNRCLNIAGASVADNANAILYTCDKSVPYNDAWSFEIVDSSGDYLHLRNYVSDKCLTVRGASTANNAEVVQYTCENFEPLNEDWKFTY